jgi:V8-like Glu-specific endopeptidase
MKACMKLRTLAAAVVVAAAGGCASAPAVSRPATTGSELASYWTEARLLAADPSRGLGYQSRTEQGKAAHLARLSLRVGALFEHDPDGDHFCTASVVASPGRDLLITAAHCINGGKNGGYRQDIVFIPGYRDGREPFGVWTPAKLLVAPQWENSSDPDYDVGFIVLKPHDGKNIEEVLGANQLGINPGYQHLVRVTGYPASKDAPVTCAGPTSRQSQSQLRFDCDGFTGGTSGSPWVTHFDPRTLTGTIVGVLGGYQEGGSTEAISYSSYLGPEVEQLYRQAVADEKSATG